MILNKQTLTPTSGYHDGLYKKLCEKCEKAMICDECLPWYSCHVCCKIKEDLVIELEVLANDDKSKPCEVNADETDM